MVQTCCRGIELCRMREDERPEVDLAVVAMTFGPGADIMVR